MSLAPGTRLGPYEVIGPLGAGGMGEVHLARDTRLDRDVALKLLPPGMAEDADAIGRFRREALTLASLNHPNIATVYGFEELPGGPMALVLERVEGETLAERLRRGATSLPEALQTGAQIAQALEVAHEHGVIHRDVKPANVMIGPRGLVKVLDFGLASRTAGLGRLSAGTEPVSAPTALAQVEEADTIALAPADGATVTASGMTAGTPGYMSPEQILAGALDARTDVFALGCVLYECLTGRRAFPGADVMETMHVTLERPADLGALPERVPERVRALIARCLAKDSEGRPRDMRVVRLELEDVLGIRHAVALREGGAALPRHNLPVPTTPFVGRETVLAECVRALDAARVLSLAGIGGSGKTRLAVALAESRLEMFPGGAWFVDVAPLTEPERVVEVLASALDVREEAGRTLLEGVTRELGTRRALIVLDNSETHLAECARLARHLLGTCRDLKILVTTREPVGIEGEVVYTVPALATPPLGAVTAAGAASEAVSLFVERARAAAPGFELTDGNAAAVVEICRALDGIPLALELAAARVRMLGVEQIRSRLGDRFKLLTRGGAPSRQQTVLATIQWSWDHLLPPEQDLMRRLAVFTGGWDLERAVEVCSDSGDEFEMLDLLTRLAERLLVAVERAADGTARYRFLESVWRFALGKVEAHPEYDALRERHLAAFLALAERAEVAMTGPTLPGQIALMARDEENLLAALDWCPRAIDGARRGLRLAAAANRFWSMLGRYAIGRRAVEEALARDVTRAPTPERAKALVRAAGFAMHMGDYAAAGPHIEESLALSRAVGDRLGMARATSGLGVVAMYENRMDDALALNEEGMALYSELGNMRGVAMVLHNLGTIDTVLGRMDHARRRFEEALARLQELGDQATQTLVLSALSVTLIRLGQLDAARQRLLECLALLQGMDAVREGTFAIEAIVEWLLAEGRATDAARLAGMAETARLALGLPHAPLERVEFDGLMAQVVERLGTDEAERARAAGRSLTLAQGLAEARGLLGEAPRNTEG